MLHTTSKKLWLLTLLVTMSVANAFADNVAKIGATEYETLQAAINAVPANTETTITLIGQNAAVSGNGFQIPDNTTGKNIIIDFNGCTYTVTGGAVGSTGTINQCMHFYKGNTLTLRNGTIKVQENLAGVKIMMQNYCDLTLDNFNVDCSNVITQTYDGYTGNDAVWNGRTRPKFNFNSGTSTITNSTITFPSNDLFGVLIDLELESAANLTIGEGTTINGNVTALGGNATINAGTITGNVSTDKVEADQAAGSIIIKGGTVNGSATATYGTLSIPSESTAAFPNAVAKVLNNNFINSPICYVNDFEDAVKIATHVKTIVLLKDVGDYTLGTTLNPSTNAAIGTINVNANDHVLNVLPGNGYYLNIAPITTTDQEKSNYVKYTRTLEGDAAWYLTNDKGKVSYVTNSTTAWSDDGNYKLLKDIEIQAITVGTYAQNVTIDLNGHKLETTTTKNSKDVKQSSIKFCRNGSATKPLIYNIVDNSTNKGGKIIAKADANDAIIISGNYNIVTIGEGVTIEGNSIVIANSSTSPAANNTLNVYGTISAGNTFAVTTNGSSTENATINIHEGAVINSTDVAVYLPGSGTCNVSGGTITGATAIYQKSGTLNITGGTITGNGTKTDFVHNGNGANATGDAVVIENCGYPGGTPVPSITGGTFISTNAKAVASYAYGNYKPITGFISSGTFSSEVNEYVAEGKKAIQETANVYKVYGVETSTGTDTAEEHQETVTVKDGNDTKQTITVSVKPTSEQTETAGDLALNQVNMSSVIDAVMEGTVLGTEENVTVAIELQVNAVVKNSDVEDDTKISFEVKPEAVVTINNEDAAAIELSNDNLAPNATFTFTLNITGLGLHEGELAKVVHKSSDPNYQDETFMATVFAVDNDKYITITTTHFSEFEITNEALSANDDITLIDGTGDYNITTDVTVKSATYKRSFSAVKIGKYQSWFVPFDYTITAEDAIKFNFFKINMIANSDTEGNAENVDDSKIWIHLKAMNVDETLYANKPYVIRPVEGEYTADEEYSFIGSTTMGSTTLKAKDEAIVRQTATSVATYDFYGTYTNTESKKHHDFLYVSVNGQICWSVANWQYSVPPYRWIIRMTAKDGNYARTINFTENNSETTGISDVNSKSEEAAANYTISGQRVSTLKKGLYIVNGKKVIMK